MASVIALLIAVIVDRYGQYVPAGQKVAKIRGTAWLNLYISKYLGWLEKMAINQSYLIVLSLVVPLLLALLILKLFFSFALGKIGAFLFMIFALWYFLGNRDVEQNSSEYVTMHETSFGVLFWFSILGLSGAMLYWFLVASNQIAALNDPNNGNVRTTLVKLHGLAAWIPARITAFIYALVGNFTPGFRCWLNCVRTPNKQSSQVLQECGEASVDSNTAGDDARLVLRAFAAWVVLSIVIILYK